MIKTVALEKIFRTEEVETLALNKVSIEVKEGEFVAIMGPSGCGKSTLLNILGLLDNPTSGEYYLNGIEVSRYTEAQRTKLRKGIIGFVFQSFNLIDELNVYENIELPLLYMGVSAAERKKKVQEAMERMASAVALVVLTAVKVRIFMRRLLSALMKLLLVARRLSACRAATVASRITKSIFRQVLNPVNLSDLKEKDIRESAEVKPVICF